MNYGMWIAASSVSTNMYRHDVAANNLANVETTAFKPDRVAVRARDAARVEDGLWFESSDELIEKLGAGIMPTTPMLSLKQGALKETGRPLDVAVEGKGFLVVQAGAGPGSERLTRDGRLGVGPDGTLVHGATGHPLLAAGGGRVRVDPNRPFEVRNDGAVFQDGVPMGALRVANVPDTSVLGKTGEGLIGHRFGLPLELTPSAAAIRQHHVEQSTVDPIKAMLGVNSASRSAQGGLRMIGIIDANTSMAISRLGRVG